MEYLHLVMRERFRQQLDAETREQFAFDRWQEPLVRQRYLQMAAGVLEAFLEQFPLVEIPLGVEVRRLAAEHLAQYNLGTHDAVHLASAQHVGVLDLASLGRGFRRVNGLLLWNNKIFGE